MLLSNEIYQMIFQRDLADLHPHYRRSYHHQQGTVVVLIVTRTNFAIVQLQVETEWPVENNQDGNDVDNR